MLSVASCFVRCVGHRYARRAWLCGGEAPVVALLMALLRWYGALAVDMRCRCVFRQDDICTVSEIVFLQELDPRCMWTEVYLDVVDVRRPEGRGAGECDAMGATRWDC